MRPIELQLIIVPKQLRKSIIFGTFSFFYEVSISEIPGFVVMATISNFFLFRWSKLWCWVGGAGGLWWCHACPGCGQWDKRKSCLRGQWGIRYVGRTWWLNKSQKDASELAVTEAWLEIQKMCWLFSFQIWPRTLILVHHYWICFILPFLDLFV